MRKILFFLLLVSGGIKAQIYTPAVPTIYGSNNNRVEALTCILLPTGCGTPGFMTLYSTDSTKGAFRLDSCGHKWYGYDPSTRTWTAFSSSTGSSGNADSLQHIIGTKYMQKGDSTIFATLWRLQRDSMDLRTQINLKLYISDTASMLAGLLRKQDTIKYAKTLNYVTPGSFTSITYPNGCPLDGVTDPTPCLRAMHATNKFIKYEGNTSFVPSDSIKIISGSVVDLGQAKFTAPDNKSLFVLENTDNTRITGGEFTGSGNSVGTSKIFVLYGATNFDIGFGKYNNVKGDGIYITNGADGTIGQRGTIHNNKFISCYRPFYAFPGRGAEYTTFTDNTWYDCSKPAKVSAGNVFVIGGTGTENKSWSIEFTGGPYLNGSHDGVIGGSHNHNPSGGGSGGGFFIDSATNVITFTGVQNYNDTVLYLKNGSIVNWNGGQLDGKAYIADATSKLIITNATLNPSYVGAGVTANITYIECHNQDGTPYSLNTVNGTIQTAAQPNITSIGTLTSLTVSGRVLTGSISTTGIGSFGGITASGTITANNFIGTITTGTQSNITSLGTLSALTVSGTSSLGSVNVTSLASTGVISSTSGLKLLGNVTLDLIERYSFTPAILTGTSGTVTLGTATGTYLREGNRVSFNLTCIASSISSPVGTVSISGLPYLNGSNNNNYSAVSIYCESMGPLVNNLLGLIQKGSNTITIYRFSAGSPTSDAANILTASSWITVSGFYFIN